MKKLALLFTVLMIAAFHAQGQVAPARLKGEVIDEKAAPVPFAVIKILTSDSTLLKGGIAGDDGQFEIDGIKPGAYLLLISSLGFEDLFIPDLTIAAGENKSLGPIRLETRNEQLQEVVVTSRRPLLQQKPDMLVLNVEGSVMAEGNDAMEILKMAPGVVVSSDDQVKLNNNSGVTIMVDGRESKVSGRDLAMVLHSIPANTIKSIEVITNPSARYDAEGTAGIINIRLKKDKNLGTNGSFQARFQKDINPNWNTSLNLNHRTRNMNLYGALVLSKGKWQETNLIDRTISLPGEEKKTFDQEDVHLDNWTSPNFRLGADFFLGSRHTIGVLASGFWSDNNSENNSQTLIRNAQSVIDSSLNSSNRSPVDQNHNTVNLNYQYLDTMGNEFRMDADYYFYNRDGLSRLRNQLKDPAGNPLSNTGNDYNTDTGIRVFSSKADYIRSFAENAKLEAGVKYSFVDTDNDLLVSIVNDGENPVVDPVQSNLFEYKEQIYAGYLNFSKNVGKFGFQAGLRAENTVVAGVSTGMTGARIERPDTSYLNLFPSAFVTYELNPNNQVRLSFSRRITRPNYQAMNPFEFFLDQFTSQKGNPYLQPQYTNSFDLTYTLMQAANFSLSYARTNNVFEEVTHQEGQKTYITTENVGVNDNFSLNISLPAPIMQWWFVYTWIGPYYSHYSGVLQEGSYTARQWGVNGYMSHNFNLKAWNLELSGFFNSATKRVIFNDRSSGSFNMALGRKVLGGNGYLKAGFNDIFGTQRWKSQVNFGPMDFNVLRTWESQQFMVNFSWNFGNKNVKAERKRDGASQDEQNRIGK
ncbi:MAG: TonB-dependent receptor [Lewinellaceae bacterium]|nr:TonB-dependent receptor [Lewinella sp.]MCB9280792.1 TonB-dependent receptor [Lewinellaceae bacterium]